MTQNISNVAESQMDSSKEIAGRFVIDSEIVKRSNCVVYTAKDKTLQDRVVAVKVFVDEPGNDAEAIRDFEAEIALLRAASHQALVPILAGGCDGGKFFIAMEYVEGVNLRDQLKSQNKKYSIEESVSLVRSIAEATGEIHAAGGIHGHIDARAVLFKGEKPRLAGYCPRAIDRLLKNLTTQGRLTVDPIYISPEQVSGAVIDSRADIYALAVLLYELVTGQRPFEGGNPLQTAMLRVSSNPVPPIKKNPEISPLLDAAILKGLAKDPASRFASVIEFVDAITGGKVELKNPFIQAGSVGGVERLGAGETVGVSMSLDALKGMLGTTAPSSSTAGKSAKESEVEGTIRGRAQSGANELPESAQTAIGMKAVEALNASLMIVEGSGMGKKFPLDKSQSIVGSDNACDVVISGKDIARRHFIIVKKQGSYFVETLSAKEIKINNEVVNTGEDCPLKRGDIIDLGVAKLRFIAPGEVFTLHEKVADRVIDRPESKARKVLVISAVLMFAMVVALFFWYSGAREDQAAVAARKASERAKKQSELIATLRKEGDQFFKEGSLIEPIGANAKERFEQILEVNPDDTYAKRRIAEISERSQDLLEKQRQRDQVRQQVEKLLADADKHFQAKEYIAPLGDNARDLYKRILELDSTNEVAKGRLAEINTIMGGMFHQVETLIARAGVYKELGQFVVPKGENAHDALKEVLALDPSNQAAKEMLLDMAAMSIFEGDLARKRGEVTAMKKAYLVAQLLGVDPQYLEPRLKGVELMSKSKAAVVIYDRKDSPKSKEDDNGKYLSRSEIESRLASLSMQAESDRGGGSQRFYDLSQKR